MPDALPEESQLPPSPDFRYVGLDVGRPAHPSAWVSVVGVGLVAATAAHAGASAGAVVGAGIVATGLIARAMGWPTKGREERTGGIAIVPWGVILEDEGTPRNLRWAAIRHVDVRTLHGRDQGTPTTRYSVVTIETDRERFVGRAPGNLPLERLAAHVAGYAAEAAHRIALDLDGTCCGEGPSEPDAELVLASAKEYLTRASAAERLGLAVLGYREVGAVAASDVTTAELSRVLRDRTARAVDPRPFAAVVAAELHAVAVADDLIDLVQSPLPLLAAIAKVAATKLGASRTKVGVLDEVEPFLHARDALTLAAWQGA